MAQIAKKTSKPTSKYKTDDKQVHKAAKIIISDINKRYGKLLKKLAREWESQINLYYTLFLATETCWRHWLMLLSRCGQ